MMKICPHCLQYFAVNEYDSDAMHRCNSGYLALDQEDVIVNGNFIGEKNEPGEGVTTEKPNPNMQGLANKLQGTFAGIQGQKLTSFTIRGAKAPTHRQRQHYEFINLR
uniref:Uncharacterized protein n=1 Tax=viral metagenome TaxID=1070528 RepID=A0A6H1ZP36_9ZZZZ